MYILCTCAALLFIVDMIGTSTYMYVLVTQPAELPQWHTVDAEE